MQKLNAMVGCEGPVREDALQFSLDRPFHAAIARITAGVSPSALFQAYIDWAHHLAFSPDKQIELTLFALHNWIRFLEYCPEALLNPDCSACVELAPNDKRFASSDWHRWPFNIISQGFLFTQQWWHRATTGVRGVSHHHEDIVAFVARQLLDVWSPANFLLTNPDVIETTIQQGGMNLLRGAMNCLEDQLRMLEGLKPVGADAYQVGRDVAVTPGKVVARNKIMELIQYASATDEVHRQPILIVPAWIMKYYILDLSPSNSLVNYLVDKGYTVFIISWKNPTGNDRDLSMDDYRRLGVMAALDAVTAIVPNSSVHAVGYCLGGTLLAIAAAAMARDGDKRLASATLLAAQTDFSEAGELTLFIDDAQVSFLEDLMAEKGTLDTRQMAGAFQMLRSNDLIWSTMVQSYLKGERPPMFDLMAWNADATRMPCRMHADYLHRLFLHNDLATGHTEVEGRPISLRDIQVPIFAVSTISDHVAPWRSVYKVQALTDADVTFVLSNGGHNAGIVNPPGKSNRMYQIATHAGHEKYVDPDSWQQRAAHEDGSWWPCWVRWLSQHSSADKVSPPTMGSPKKGYGSLCDAPGTYVLAP